MKPLHRDLLDARAWNRTDAANDPPDDNDWEESNLDLDGMGWESFMSEFAEYPVDVNPDVGPDPPLYGASWGTREHPIPWLEEEYGDGAEAGEKEYSGWEDSGLWSPVEHGVGDVFPESWEGEDLGVDYARWLQQNHAVPNGVELPPNTWGFWGQEGPRIFDETCYMRHEEVLPVRDRPKMIIRIKYGEMLLVLVHATAFWGLYLRALIHLS